MTTYSERIIREIIIPFDAVQDIWWSTVDGELFAYADCSDLFMWACSDGERITEADIPDVVQAYRDTDLHGGLLWCCRKRGMRPQGAYYECLKDYAALFDACGPRRETGFGNPQDQDVAMGKAA